MAQKKKRSAEGSKRLPFPCLTKLRAIAAGPTCHHAATSLTCSSLPDGICRGDRASQRLIQCCNLASSTMALEQQVGRLGNSRYVCMYRKSALVDTSTEITLIQPGILPNTKQRRLRGWTAINIRLATVTQNTRMWGKKHLTISINGMTIEQDIHCGHCGAVYNVVRHNAASLDPQWTPRLNSHMLSCKLAQPQ